MASEYFAALGVAARSGDRLTAALPFGAGDVTVGTENELQTAVRGDPATVDLPRSIVHSGYYAMLAEQARDTARGRKLYSGLTEYLERTGERVWESSWVRLPRSALNAFGNAVLEHDLCADKRAAQSGGRRADAAEFVGEAARGEIRIPVSYLLKLAMANLLGEADRLSLPLRRTGVNMLDHFINDNTSPEQHSVYISVLAPALGMGRAVARENAARFLLTQVLLAYANDAMGLRASGQEASAYFSALPPVRQRHLAACLSDNFYRKLFMNPCLSGWDRGEDKHRYMHLCHEVLSRSRMNALLKLQDLGIAAPSASPFDYRVDTSLANNGTHVSLGSRRISCAIAADPKLRHGEKLVGDLAIKIFEHFLPLFVGTHSAAPRWLAPADLKPERLLAFLPHQLAPAHLRMLWRSWSTSAPARTYMPDARLMDYFVSLSGTARHPALNGVSGNSEALKRTLTEQGVFDERMPLYLSYRLREHANMGYSGFEGRYYSVFPSFAKDLAPAVELQALITSFAMKCIALGTVGHQSIPDDPMTESERRQFLFASAMGVPHCHVRIDSKNALLARILRDVDGVRASTRVAGHLTVPIDEYRLGLLRVLNAEAREQIEAMGLDETMRDLAERIHAPSERAAARLSAAVVHADTVADAEQINLASERYLRDDLRLRHISEAFALVLGDISTRADTAELLSHLLDGRSATAFLAQSERALSDGSAQREMLVMLAQVLLLAIHADAARHAAATDTTTDDETDSAPIYRTGNG